MAPARGEDGITLIEIIVSIAILGFVLTAYVAAQTSALQSLTDSRARQDASQASTEVVERLRNLSYSAVAMAPTFDSDAVSCGTAPDGGPGWVDVFGDSTCERLVDDPDDLLFTGVIDDAHPWAASLGAVDFVTYATAIDGAPEGRVRVTVVSSYDGPNGAKEIRRSTIFSEVSRG